MKPVAAAILGLAVAALASGASAQTGFGSKSQGTFGSGGGTFGSVPRATPPANSPPSFGYSPSAPVRTYDSKPPSLRPLAPLGAPEAEPFKPYKPFKGQSLYGDPDVAPQPKPWRYISPY